MGATADKIVCSCLILGKSELAQITLRRSLEEECVTNLYNASKHVPRGCSARLNQLKKLNNDLLVSVRTIVCVVVAQ